MPKALHDEGLQGTLKDGHQTQVVTTRFDLSAVEVAQRMFSRLRRAWVDKIRVAQ
jgi:hypothetical protein